MAACRGGPETATPEKQEKGERLEKKGRAAWQKPGRWSKEVKLNPIETGNHHPGGPGKPGMKADAHKTDMAGL
jgi:hypothetical protein